MTVTAWKEVLRKNTWVSTDGNKDERAIRKAISELRKEGIIYIPAGTYKYLRVEAGMTKEVEQFVAKQIKHLATQYFNTVKPLRDYVSDEKLIDMMGQLSFMELL
jgi:DNA-binding transcriptional regulator YhcF (GntR family)